MKIKRYRLDGCADPECQCYSGMVENPQGEYVKYDDDFAASESALIALLAFHLKEQIFHVKNLSDPYGMTTWRTEKAEKLLKEINLSP